MTGRMAGHADVLGPDRACGEPERDGTHPHPERRTKGRPGPAALPDGCPRRVLGRPGPARRREDPVRRPARARLLVPAAPAVLRVEFQTAGPVRPPRAVSRRLLAAGPWAAGVWAPRAGPSRRSPGSPRSAVSAGRACSVVCVSLR